jgi:hypothetical protein
MFILSGFSKVLAEDNINNNELAKRPDIIISEVQTGGEISGTSSHEFIELYNNGTDVVNLMGYKLIYVTSTGSNSELYVFNEPYLFLPETFMVGKLKFSSETFLSNINADFIYDKGETGLAMTAGGLKLIDNEDTLVDELYWTSASNSDKPAVTELVGGKSAQRYFLDEQLITDETANFVNEYIVDQPTPQSLLRKTTPPIEPPNDEDNEPLIDPPDTKIDQAVNPPILINELFIDPESPLLDSKDEFIELYNPHDQNIDISNYKLTTGLSTKYNYVIPIGSVILAKSYFTLYAKDTSLTLSNSGSMVVLQDNLGNQISEVSYTIAKAGESWATVQGLWQWTSAITPDAQNIPLTKVDPIKPTTVAKASSTKTTSKSAKTNLTNAPPIIINEIYPDPISPQKDSIDEFIELYNPHDFAINIADYTVMAGTDKKYKYVIKSPATIQARGYYVLTSADTTLSLNNSGGLVTLANNYDKTIASLEYPKAVPGASWSYINGNWQWTSKPTKNSVNLASDLVDGLLNTKQNEPKTKVAGASVAGTDNTPLVNAPQPLPAWALAVLGLSAICYAGYEYRFEARNYYYKFRRIRSLR